jgi:hypothetical protein
LAITTAMCTSFKGELLEGLHDFTNHDFYIALFDDQATLGASTTDYTTSDEVVGVGYTAGGNLLGNNGVSTSGTTAFVDFADSTWSTATITAAGAMIYNSTTGGGTGTTEAVCVLDFGGNKTSTAGDFVIQFPAADASNAIIRIA